MAWDLSLFKIDALRVTGLFCKKKISDIAQKATFKMFYLFLYKKATFYFFI